MATPRTLFKIFAVLVLLGAGALVWLWSSDDASETPARDEMVPEASAVDALDWLAGCWTHAEPGFQREEQWMEPRGGTIIGMSRTVAEGRTVETEYLRIEARDEGLAFIANPSGQSETTFMQAELADTIVVFEAPEHDFPQRIVYKRMPGGAILAWIEGEIDGVSRVVEFPLAPTRCP
jgi:hypothetical protein